MSVSNEPQEDAEFDGQLLNSSPSVPPPPPPPPPRERTKDDATCDVMNEVMSEDAIQGRVLDKLRTGFSAIEEMGYGHLELSPKSVASA